MEVTTRSGREVEMTVATDEELVLDVEGMMGRWTDYAIDVNDAWHRAMIAELARRSMWGTLRDLAAHRYEQEHACAECGEVDCEVHAETLEAGRLIALGSFGTPVTR